MQEETFNLPELKRLLLRQLERSPGSAAAAGPSAVIQEMMEAGASSAVRPDLVPPAPPLFKETPWEDEAVIPVPDKSEKQPFEPLKKRLFLLLGAVLVLCFVWKLYAENPNEQKLYLSAGSTVFLGAALLWGYRRMGRERGYERPGSIELGSAGVLAPKAEEEAARHAFLSVPDWWKNCIRRWTIDRRLPNRTVMRSGRKHGIKLAITRSGRPHGIRMKPEIMRSSRRPQGTRLVTLRQVHLCGSILPSIRN